jgi:adenylylsulfate kinase
MVLMEVCFMQQRVFWITGLSASGKTTLGTELTQRIRDNGANVIFLDGDNLRFVLGELATHSREDRVRLAYTYARLCQMLCEQGVVVVIATVALFSEIHAWNRENLLGYFEIFLDVPISELRNRDPKGIYKQFDQGKIKNVAGLDLKVDFPSNPDLHFIFDPEIEVHEMAQTVLDYADLNGYKASVSS